MPDESISQWITGIKDGDEESARELWDRYFHRLVALGRRVLQTTPRRAGDEEDVALSAFKSFCLRAREDRFPKLDDREDLWKLLMTITMRKAFRTARKEGKAAVTEESFFQEQLVDAQPTSDFVRQLEEEIDHLISGLEDERIRAIALAKLEGYTNAEIAVKVERSVSFVERKLQLLRHLWTAENEG